MTPPALRATSPASLGRRRLRLAEWQLALPLALAFVALFLAPLLLLVATSFFNDDKITQPGFASWAKFFGDPFNYKVIFDTLLLGPEDASAPPSSSATRWRWSTWTSRPACRRSCCSSS